MALWSGSRSGNNFVKLIFMEEAPPLLKAIAWRAVGTGEYAVGPQCGCGIILAKLCR